MKAQHKLDECLQTIVNNFLSTENKYEAHLKSYPILHRLSEDDEVIQEVIRRNIDNDVAFTKSNCTPDFQLTLIDTPHCFLFVNFFGPNAEKRTDISYSTMHHHDDYLLSTINAKGKGYTSLIFKQGYEIDRDNMTAKIELEKFALHAPRHIEFIDNHTAHAIFYPESTTMTYGLWSTYHNTTRTSRLRDNPIIQKNKDLVKRLISKLKVNPKDIGVQQYREDYFYPEDGTLHFLPGQVQPENGAHFTQNYFNIAQQFLEFDDKSFLKQYYSKKKEQLTDKMLWVEKMIENETIDRNYDGYEMYMPKRNIHIDEYKHIYNFNN